MSRIAPSFRSWSARWKRVAANAFFTPDIFPSPRVSFPPKRIRSPALLVKSSSSGFFFGFSTGRTRRSTQRIEPRALNHFQHRLREDTDKGDGEGERNQRDSTRALSPVQRRIVTAHARLQQEQRDHHAQVVIETDCAAENQQAEQPPEFGV